MACMTAKQLRQWAEKLERDDDLPAVTIGNGDSLYFFKEKGKVVAKVYDPLAGMNGRNYRIDNVNGRRYDYSHEPFDE